MMDADLTISRKKIAQTDARIQMEDYDYLWTFKTRGRPMHEILHSIIEEYKLQKDRIAQLEQTLADLQYLYDLELQSKREKVGVVA
jgi:hypothetical protein